MTRTAFVLMMIVIAAVFFLGMWIAWRARARRDAGIRISTAALTGETLASFPRAGYVSTTPLGSPFERVAIPGLRYKGYADVEVRADGVSITVTGEDPVRIPAEQLAGTGTAGGRIGKAVERDGLSLLRWHPHPRTGSGSADGRERVELESSFRFTDPAEQLRFAEAITAITPNQTPTTATQEDA